jgi:HSP20 family protein
MPPSTNWRHEASGAFNVLHKELNRLLEEYLEPRYRGAQRAPTDLEPTTWSPAVDVYDTAEELIVVAEVPGVEPTSIDLALTDNVLSLRGVKEAGGLPEPLLQVRERRFGAFHRELALPGDVDFDKVRATANQGVLTVRLPKRVAAKPRTIPIQPN